MSETTADTSTPNDASKIGDAWGDDISDERKGELDAMVAAWEAETDHGDRKGPFDYRDVIDLDNRLLAHFLTGADVFYLAKRALVVEIGKLPIGRMKGLMNDLISELLPTDDFVPNIDLAPWDMETAQNVLLDPDRHVPVFLSVLNLQGANLSQAQLTGANLREIQLSGANLEGAQLANANLQDAQLVGADLSYAQLSHSNLYKARLMGANLTKAQLIGTDLRSAKFDRDTELTDAKLASISLDKTSLDNTSLAVVSWQGVAPLGDEVLARAARHGQGIAKGVLKSREAHIVEYEAAARANRLLATALRAQGNAEDADVFAYRAQLMQRGLRFQRRQFGRWLVSWGLSALSGYGYRLGRIFAAYAIVVLTFAALFLLPVFLAGGIPSIQNILDALQISLNAIHGRVFFVQFGLDTLQSWLATAESVIGIVIEGVFVAMIIQRLFR
jgi:hypothetical protein